MSEEVNLSPFGEFPTEAPTEAPNPAISSATMIASLATQEAAQTNELEFLKADFTAMEARALAAEAKLALVEAKVKAWFEAMVASTPSPHLLSLETHIRQQWHTLREWLDI